MLKNSGVLFFELYIDDIAFNTEEITVDCLQIFSSALSLLPTATIIAYDPANLFDNKITLADGMTVTILLGPDENTFYQYDFRIFSFTQNPYNGTTVYKIDCYWDAPRYLSDIATKPYEGPSTQVLKDIAGECDLLTDIAVSTSDSMIWNPRNKKYGHFAKDVALHGYSSDSSIMCLGVDLLGTLTYKDLSIIPQNGRRFIRGNTEQQPEFPKGNEDGATLVYTNESINKAGFFNHHAGYNQEIVEQTIMSSTVTQRHKEIQVKKLSNYLMMNKEVKGLITKGKREFVPFNVGNVHTNYQKAIYQNNRGMCNYNLGQHLIVKDHTDVQLFDPIVYQSDQATNTSGNQMQTDDADSGNYLVLGRNLQIIGGLQYSEKITVVRTGLNSDPSGTNSQV